MSSHFFNIITKIITLKKWEYNYRAVTNSYSSVTKYINQQRAENGYAKSITALYAQNIIGILYLLLRLASNIAFTLIGSPNRLIKPAESA